MPRTGEAGGISVLAPGQHCKQSLGASRDFSVRMRENFATEHIRIDARQNIKPLVGFGTAVVTATSGARQAEAGLTKACNLKLRQMLVELPHRWFSVNTRSEVRWFYYELQRPMPVVDGTAVEGSKNGLSN